MYRAKIEEIFEFGEWVWSFEDADERVYYCKTWQDAVEICREENIDYDVI